jgi:hypothetical protein
MPEENQSATTMTAAEQRMATYNRKMAGLFTERNKYPVDSPEREVAARAILALWVAEGE